MKLYTEEQMIQAYDAGFQDFKEGLIGRSYYVVETITPIELPSDEEIEKELLEHIKVSTIDPYKSFYFKVAMYGAKLMKEQILNQNY